VTPANLREAHAHIALHGRAMAMLDLGVCASVEECLERVGREAARTPPGSWVLARSMRVQGWRQPRPPTAAELHAAARGRPCCLWSFDLHALVASPAALAAAGVERSTPDPAHGVIVRDARSGEPTGLMLERAAHLVWAAVPEPAPAERFAHVCAALADLEHLGFVEVHELHAPPWLGETLAHLADEGDLRARIEVFEPLDDIESARGRARAWSRPGLRLAGAKVFADGTLNSRTAWMLHPYRDPVPGLERGQRMKSADEIARAVRRVDALGLGLAVHAIGDAAVREVLDGFERALPAVRGAGPWRIEHAEVVDERDVPRFARLGVTCSVQPCHLLADIEALRRHLPHRLDRVLPLRDLIDAGCEPGRGVLFGSDVPIVRADPADGILAATARRRAGMPAPDAIAPAQAISEPEACRAYRAAPAPA
jgi:predicted amidohydrolase YtcJ